MKLTNRIDKGYKLFWGNLKSKRKTAPPKFKAWRKYRSFSYNMVGSKIIKDNTIEIAGNKYKFFKSREVEGKIKVLTVKRDACGDFYVYLVCEMPEVKIESRLGKSIGFDFGFKGKMLVAPNEKDDIVAPDFFKRQQKVIAKANRKLSTKRLRSNNRRKAHLVLARLHRKVVNQRKAYHQKRAGGSPCLQAWGGSSRPIDTKTTQYVDLQFIDFRYKICYNFSSEKR